MPRAGPKSSGGLTFGRFKGLFLRFIAQPLLTWVSIRDSAHMAACSRHALHYFRICFINGDCSEGVPGREEYLNFLGVLKKFSFNSQPVLCVFFFLFIYLFFRVTFSGLFLVCYEDSQGHQVCQTPKRVFLYKSEDWRTIWWMWRIFFFCSQRSSELRSAFSWTSQLDGKLYVAIWL